MPESTETTTTQEKIVLPTIIEPKSAYLANMKVLWAVSPSLAQEIDLVGQNELIPIQPSRSGAATCQLKGPANGNVFVHSKYDPRREAARWADAVEELAEKQCEPESGRVPMCYFVNGFGLGYHLKTLFEKLRGEAFIVISEPNMALLRTALETTDYSEMLDSDRVIIITRADRDEIFKKLQRYSTMMMMGVIFTRPLQRIEPEFHAAVHKLVSEYASYLRSHMVSLLSNGIATSENVLQNLASFVGTDSVDIVKNRFAGLPAVVVSAGPSLQKNIDTLKNIRDRIVLIAVQTTLKPLLAAGIKPDFVTSLDYHQASRRFFDGLGTEQLKDIHLIAEPKANWHVVDYYRGLGPISLLGNEMAQLLLKDIGDKHANLPAGATVAHLAFYLAEYIGADPIIFVGQDLAFTGNVYYSPGTALHTLWRPEFNRFSTIEMKEWERIVRHRNILRKVPDIHGKEIYTDEQMFTYLQQFEKDFAKCPRRIIDATEGGCLKRACETMTLAETAESYCKKPIPQEKFEYRRKMKLFDKTALAPAAEQVVKAVEEVGQLERISSETLELVKEMLELIDDQNALNQKMVRLDELRTMVKHRTEIYRMVMHVSQGAELYRFKQDRALGIETIEGQARQRRQLQRDVGYVSEIQKGCVRLADMLNTAEKRLQEAIDGDEMGK